ncbi:homoserine O-succinyltransferase [Orbaceae bacterium ac157xtp]
MPVIIPETLPASQFLKDEGIFVINEQRAKTQDIRPLKIAILNLMPNKIVTETQLIRKLSNSIVQVEITLVAIKDHQVKNTAQSHLDSFYDYFDDIKTNYYDAMIFTGAPIEHLEFTKVSYWEEFINILDWAKTHVFSSLFICWASQAALWHFYGIDKYTFAKKLFGVFPHKAEVSNEQLFLGMDNPFYAPHSRHTTSDEAAIRSHPELTVLASSNEGGIYAVKNTNQRQLFISGHAEYDENTLFTEYLRDADSEQVTLPKNYFINDNPEHGIETKWKSDASLFFQNWLNYYVYQTTDYILKPETFILNRTL